MKLEQAKSQILPGVVTPSKKQAPAKTTPLQAKAATPAQLQRSKNKLEQDRSQIQRQAEQASIQRESRATIENQARVQRVQDQAVALEQQSRVQRLADTQARQQSFFSSFVKSPVQRKSQQQVKTSSVQTAQARDQYQAAVQPEILQRLVDDRLSLQSQQTRAAQPKNDLNARAEWFNTELPVLRAKHNRPDTPFLDGANVFQPADQQAFTLGKTYGVQRLASGLTPKDAANAILNIQRKADRDIAMRGLLTGVNPRQSDYTSIQRLVAQGEGDLELQRQALSEDPAMQSQALQLAKDEAHPTSPNSGISDKIKTKLGGGNPLPENVRQQLEMGLNTDLSSVRVHTDSEADFLSKSVQAKAFTTGNDIFFSSGAFDPNTKSGYELIAHETTHTLQQAAGQVRPGIDSDPSLETAAQSKGAELASGFNPNFKYKNLENQAQPNSPLIASQPPAHRVKIQAMQRSSLNVQREPQAPTPVVAPTVSQTLDETALATLTTALLPVVPQKYQADAQSNIPVILRQCFASQITNANQVAYILATAQHESRFGTELYSRSESLVEDHNPLQTEHKKVKDKKTGKTTVQDIPYRSNHVTGNRVNADPKNTADLDKYYDDAYGGKLGNAKNTSDAANYRGRGFVQITGRDNYKRLGKQLQNEGFTYTYNNQTYGTKEQPIDLVANPTHVNLVPELAAKIMVSGMQNDSFAQGGKGLSTYVNDKTTDFVGARGLVNGTDRAADIAKIAENFAKVLTANNAWGNLFKAPDLTKQSPDATKPGVTPSRTTQRSALGLQRDIAPPSKAKVHNMTYDTLLEAMAVSMGYKDELDQKDENLLKQFGYSHSANNIGEAGLQTRLFYPSQKSYPHAVLVFRGTEAGLNAEGARDIIADVDPIGPGHSQWRDNKASIKRTLEYAVERTRSRVWVTGHSLGGAIAQYAGANFPDLVGRIITFQAPAITGRDVGELEKHNHKNPKKRVDSTHYEVEGDLVPNSPHFNPIGRNLRNMALGGVRKTPGSLTTFKTKYGDTLKPLDAHMATPLYNQLQITSPEAYAPFERNGFTSNNEFYPTQRARATQSTSSKLVIQASRDTNISSQTKAPLISSQPVLQNSSLSLQRDPKPQSGQPDAFSELKTQVQPYQIMRNSSPNSKALRNYMYGEGKSKWDAAEQNAKTRFAELSYSAPPTATDRTNILFSIAMSTFFNDSKAQSIFVLGRVLDPQTITNLKNQYNALQGAEKQAVFGLIKTEFSSIPIIQFRSTTITENEMFGSVAPKFIEFCLYKVMLAKYPQTSSPKTPTKAAGGALSGLGAAIDSAGITLRKAPGTTSEAVQRYPQRSVFFIEKAPEDPTWFKARAMDGKEGYIAGYLVSVAPEIGAKLYEIKSGDNASSIVINNYPNMDGMLKRSERHKMIAALSYLNPTLMPKPNDKNGWDDVKTFPGFIWLPSLEFAKKIASQVVVNDDFAGKFADGTANVADKSLTALAETGEYVVKNVLKQLPGGDQVLETIQKIGANAGKVLDDPGAFVKHLGQAVSKGFGQFTANLPQHLEASVVKLFTGTMGNIDLPKTWDATGVLHVGLQVIGGTPEQLKQKLISAVPGGQAAIDASGEAKAAFSSIQQNGFAATARQYYEGDALQETIIGGIKSYVINTVVKQGMIALGSMFIPGAGLVQAAIKLYETIKFVWEKMKDIAATFSAISSSLAEIAAGNIDAAATKVKDSLVLVLGLGVGFLAKVARLDGIADKVKALFKKIKDPIEKAIAKVIAWFKGLVGGKGKTTTPATAPKGSDKPEDTKVSTGKEPKSLSAFKQFAAKFGAKTSRITAFADDKTSDDTHDGKVASGITFLQNAEKTALQNLKGDSSFTLDVARGVANQTKSNNSIFKNVNVVQKGVGFSYQLIASETIITAIDPAKVAAHLENLRSEPIPSLEELKKIEPGVDERYVIDFEIRENAGLNKQDFRAYIGGRASRKLGKIGETDSIAIYNKASGNSVTKNNQTFEITKGKDKGTVIPDFYSAGKVVGDIKDVAEISFTSQLRRVDQIARAKDAFIQKGSELQKVEEESKFDLVVRKSTQVFGPLRDAVRESGGNVYPILEDK
jgi:predicted chitinase